MTQFVLIDHSIKRLGGHNFEYAYHVLGAAERAGLSPVLAANARFLEGKRVPSTWRVLPCFRHTTYEIGKLRDKQQRLERQATAGNTSRDIAARASNWINLPNWIRSQLAARYERLQRQIVDRFAEDLDGLLSRLALSAGDQVFVPTLNEHDLVGLLNCVRRRGSPGAARWHLQFHFKVFEGREPDYNDQQPGLDELKALFQRAVQTLGPSARYYTTTEHLARQYNRLAGPDFTALPYPVNPGLRASVAKRVSERTLRVTCPGGVRPEKGTQLLATAIQPVWEELFAGRRLRLVVQAKRLGKLPTELRRHARYDRAIRLEGRHESAVAVIRWPLSTEQYLDLIRQSDIGLLLYDSLTYYCRCSGVLVEMLSAGVPVIAPAGCWMADQLSRPIQQYRRQLLASSEIANIEEVARPPMPRLRTESESTSSGPTRLTADLAVPQGATHAMIEVRIDESVGHRGYLSVQCDQIGGGHMTLDTDWEILSADGVCSYAFVKIGSDAKRLSLTVADAYGMRHDSAASLCCHFITGSDRAVSCPSGAVGLVAANVAQVPRLLRELTNNYPHYRRTAGEFASAWGAWHSPEQVVAELIANSIPVHSLDKSQYRADPPHSLTVMQPRVKSGDSIASRPFGD